MKISLVIKRNEKIEVYVMKIVNIMFLSSKFFYLIKACREKCEETISNNCVSNAKKIDQNDKNFMGGKLSAVAVSRVFPRLPTNLHSRISAYKK